MTSSGAPIAEYDYDDNGNRTAHRYVGGSATATYDDQGRLLTYGDTTYQYTANGELKSKTVGGATTTFDYDAVGNLRKAIIPGGRTIDYVIDVQNRRVWKKVNGTVTHGWLYTDQLRIAAELDSFPFGCTSCCKWRPNAPLIRTRPAALWLRALPRSCNASCTCSAANGVKRAAQHSGA